MTSQPNHQPDHQPGSRPDYTYGDYSNLRPDNPDDGRPLELTIGGEGGSVAGGNPTGGAAPGQPGAPIPEAGTWAPSYEDDAETPVSTAPADSLAEELSAEFGSFTVPTCTVPIPGRRGWAFRFRLDWTEQQARERRAKAADPTAQDGISSEKLFRHTIIEQNVAILRRRDGEEDWTPVTVNGRVVNLRDPALWPLLRHPSTKLQARSATSALAVLCPIYTQLASVGVQLSRAAGQEDLLDPLDLED